MDNLQPDHEVFDKVWQRVLDSNRENTSEQPTQSVQRTDAEILEEFMEDEAFDAAYYTLLSNRVGGGVRSVLRAMANDERAHLKKLRTAYFILTGDTYTPQTVPVKVAGVADALRKRYIAETEASAAYLKAAANAGRPDLTELYKRLSEDERRHSELVNRMLEALMG